MDSRILLSISTYKKNESLRSTLLQASLNLLGPISGIHIADADDGSAEEVYLEFKNQELPFSLHYATEKDSFIFNTKNMGIEFFLEQTSCPFLILSDDDNIFMSYNRPLLGRVNINEALLEAHVNTQSHHLLTYPEDYRDPLTQEDYFTKFPIISATPWTKSCAGAQGHYMFYSRLAVESAGYFNAFPGRYGGEHAEYSARINTLSGQCPTFFTYLDNCHRYIRDGDTKNNYQVNQKELDKNMSFYYKRLEEIYSGKNLTTRRRPR